MLHLNYCRVIDFLAPGVQFLSDQKRGGAVADSRLLRKVLGKFVTGVVVVTASGPEGPVGITANSFTSVSLDPPLVLFCLHASSRMRRSLVLDGSFAVNILSRHHESLSRHFSGPVDRRADGIDFRRGVTGSPLLAEALAYLECDLCRLIEAGDHIIVIGKVQDCSARSSGDLPLAFYGGRYVDLRLREQVG
jgi:3-hydroxy-9,10-secoandrosta-1,3,5(10)-triene-9,17-dione monooxygenase reductase component